MKTKLSIGKYLHTKELLNNKNWQVFDLKMTKKGFDDFSDEYNVLLCQDHLTKHSYFTHYATNRNS